MGIKATPDLDLIAAPETTAFRAVENVLKRDGVFSRAVNTFSAWRGEDADLFEPAYSFCPFLKMSPWPTESQWITEGQHEAPLTIRFQAAVRGSKFDNLANFWNVIRLAIFPQDVTASAVVRTQLQAALIVRPTLTMNAYGVVIDEEGLRMLVADGSFRFYMMINT